MTVNPTYLDAPNPALAVTGTEFATGRGFLNLFLGNVAGSNRLSDATFYSEKINIVGAANAAGETKTSIDEDFDLDFNKTIIIEGEAVINLNMGMSADGTATYNVIPTVKIRKWDGSTETEVVSVTGTTTVMTMQVDWVKLNLNTIVLNIPRTTYKFGESLRVSVSVTIQRSSGSGSAQIALVNDPKGRLINTVIDSEVWTVGTANRDIDWATIPNGQGTAITISQIQVPIKIDV